MTVFDAFHFMHFDAVVDMMCYFMWLYPTCAWLNSCQIRTCNRKNCWTCGVLQFVASGKDEEFLDVRPSEFTLCLKKYFSVSLVINTAYLVTESTRLIEVKDIRNLLVLAILWYELQLPFELLERPFLICNPKALIT